jgi:hypothetical protein
MIVELQNYGLLLEGGCAVAFDDSLTGLRITPPPDRPGAITLTIGYGTNRLPLANDPLTIALAGERAGCLGFRLVLRGKQSDPDAWHATIDQLDIGPRFFYQDAEYPDMGVLTSRRYPVFDAPQADVTLLATLDPLAPLDPARSELAFAANTPAIPSFYRTILGRDIVLTPQPGSRLVFQPRTVSIIRSAYDPLYLAPDGPFLIQATDNTAPQLLCGTQGAEYVELTADGSILTFAAGQPAFAPLFRLDQAAAPEPGDAPRLSDLATTAWAALGGATATLVYYAQPQSAPLFGPLEHGEFLPYYPVAAASLPPLSDGPLVLYPLVPYAGASDDDYTAYSRLEVEVLSQERRRAIADGALPARGATAAAATVLGETGDPCRDTSAPTAITPQGLLARFSTTGNTWACLTLARLGADILAFQPVVDPLRAALLTNQQFLVISDPQAIMPYFTRNTSVAIEDWRFQLAPETWRQHGTILLIKNYDKSLRELAADPTTWVLGNVFNAAIDQTQARLKQIIADAEAQLNLPEPNLDYEHFVRTVVDDKGWNGILFLNCALPPVDFAPEAKVLAADIDPTRFFAHHLGINQTPIEAGATEMKNSSLFGVVSYTKPEDALRSAGRSYDFQVLAVRMLFRNSALAQFSARVTVALSQLFGAPASLAGSTSGSALALTGGYQLQGSARALVFRLEQERIFDLDDAVLASARIDRAQLATVQSAAGQQAGTETVRGRFTFWGELGFRRLDALGKTPVPFDIFSYEKLAFANLGLDMSFQLPTQGAIGFGFDPTQLSFDPSRSATREGSLARNFPLKLVGFLAGDAKKPPGKLGYLRAYTPLDAGKIGETWYALLFELNLGTLGALASEAGFTANLAAAWSPGAAKPQPFVGLKLPYSSGGGRPQISLYGILKLTMRSIELLAADGAFMLKLNGIALSILKKTLPPGGSFDFYIFGDPAGTPTLAWYGAFAKDQTAPPRTTNQSTTGRATGPNQPPTTTPRR